MTQPVQEPTQGRTDSGQEFRTRQLFRRPSPVVVGPYAWMHKETNWTLASSATGSNVTTYDTSGGAMGTAFSVDLTAGTIAILETGVYVFEAGALFTATANPCCIELAPNVSALYPLISRFGNETGTAFTSNRWVSVAALIVIDELFGVPDDYVEGYLAQVTGSDKTVTRFSLVAYKLRGL